MYARAREIIKPGINELDVFNELQAVAVRECGEMLTGTGNDYACGERGGPPRNRQAVDGELYILDLGPAFRGYFADNCRAFAVNGKPTEPQLAAWRHIKEVFTIIAQRVKPGVRCKAVFEEVDAHLSRLAVGRFRPSFGARHRLVPTRGAPFKPVLGRRLRSGRRLHRRAGTLRFPRIWPVPASAWKTTTALPSRGLSYSSDFPLEL